MQGIQLATEKKYIFQCWNVVGSLLYYHWLIIGSFTGYSNIGKWLYFPTLENGCYSIQQYSNVSSIGTLYFPLMEDRFQTLEHHFYQCWYCNTQHWILGHSNIRQKCNQHWNFLYSNNGLVLHQHWHVTLSSVGENVSNTGYMHSPTSDNSFATLDH